MCVRKGLFLLYRYRKFCTISRKEGSGRPSKITDYVREIVERQMRADDETTAMQLHEYLTRFGISLNIRTVLRSREQLGWTFRGSAYCQLIRDVNKQKRLQWALENCNDRFENVVFTDESSIQIETHCTKCYRKKGEKPRNKPRPKHPLKVHVWAGISTRGATDICIFTGIMNAEIHVNILDQFLFPFVGEVFGSDHRFIQDNDPKHVSRRVQRYFEENIINWWRTPPESPDLNPIENVWHELKDFLRAKVKPRNLAELKAGIKTFWSSVSPAKCAKYINHLKKVIPRTIELQGDATGY